MAEEIELARCAEIAACLDRFPAGNHAEVVARFGLRWAEWRSVASRWAAARDAELAAGKTELASRFARAFAATQDKLGAERASLESIGPLPHSFRLEATDDEEAALDPASPAPVVEARQLLAGAGPLAAPPYRPQPAARPMAATVGVSAVMPAPSLPFVEGSPAEALERAHAAAARGTPRVAPAAGGTALAPESAAPAPLPPGVPPLTLEQYTSLRVEMQLLPAHAAAVLARYGVRPEAQAPLFAHWQARFTADGALKMLFAQRYAQYLGWLQQSPGALQAITRGAR
jgi:hypothetical protein